jgi:hypothetical protein
MFFPSTKSEKRTGQVLPEVGRRQIIYTHVNNCKNDKNKIF